MDELSPGKQIIATIALILGSFLFVLDYTIANVAIPYIAGGLAAGVSEGTYVITSFAVGNAIFIPMAGYFSDRFGMIRTLGLSLFLFTFFSALCGAAPTLVSLVIFRFLQGAAAGPLIPLSQGLLVMIQKPKHVNTVLGIFSMVVLVAPVLGPIIGGYFCLYWEWRWIFYINVPIGIFCTVVVFETLSHLNKVNLKRRVDYISFALLFVGMSALQIFLDKGQEWDWFGSERIWVLAIIAFLGTFYLLLWTFMTKKPLLELSLLRVRNFAIACIVIFFAYSTYIGSVVIIPLWLQTEMGYTALAAGIAVAPIGIGSIIISIPIAKAMKWTGPIWPMLIGFILVSISNLYVRYFPFDVDRYHIMLSRLILGFGIGFWLTPLFMMATTSLPKEKLASGLGIFHFIRGLSGGIGTSVCTTMYLRRQIHQHENLIANIRSCPESAAPLANHFIDQQASVIAINEVFQAMTYCTLFLCFILLFAFKGSTKPADAPLIVAD